MILAGEDEETGIHKTELINWYLKEMEHEIDTEAELVEKKMVVEKVIHKLIHVVRKKLLHVVCKKIVVLFFLIQKMFYLEKWEMMSKTTSNMHVLIVAVEHFYTAVWFSELSYECI